MKDRLLHVIQTPFKRITYTEAVEILVEKIKDKKAKAEEKPLIEKLRLGLTELKK